MPKSQKKSAATKEKPQVTRKPGKGANKASLQDKKPNKTAQPKAAKKIAATPQKPARDSKQSKVIGLLQRPAGATIDEMAKATGWQKHGVQGMMSGVLKKRLGLTITSTKEERGRVYRITGSVSRL